MAEGVPLGDAGELGAGLDGGGLDGGGLQGRLGRWPDPVPDPRPDPVPEPDPEPDADAEPQATETVMTAEDPKLAGDVPPGAAAMEMTALPLLPGTLTVIVVDCPAFRVPWPLLRLTCVEDALADQRTAPPAAVRVMVPVEDEPSVRLSGAAVSVAVDGGGAMADGRTGACDEVTGRVAATARASVLVVLRGTGGGDERTLAGRLTLTGTVMSAPPPSGADAEADGAGGAMVGPLARMAVGMPLKPRTANSVVTPRAHAPATIARRPGIRRRRADGAFRRPVPAGRPGP